MTVLIAFTGKLEERTVMSPSTATALVRFRNTFMTIEDVISAFRIINSNNDILQHILWIPEATYDSYFVGGRASEAYEAVNYLYFKKGSNC